MEETGLVIKNLRRGPFTNDIMTEEGKHYITLYLVSEWESGKPKILEADKCEEIEWFDWNNLPLPLFTPLKNLRKTGFDPFLC